MTPLALVSFGRAGGMPRAVPLSIALHAALAGLALLWAWDLRRPHRDPAPEVAAQIELVRGDGAQRTGGAAAALPEPVSNRPEQPQPDQTKPEETKPAEKPVEAKPEAAPPPSPAEAAELPMPPPQSQPAPPATAVPAPPPPPPTPAAAPIQAPPSPAFTPDVRLGDGLVDPQAMSNDPLAFVQADGDPNNVAPDYPLEAARRHEMGQVLLGLHIDEAGHVGEVDILRSSGSPRLDEAARKALSGWHYRPAFRDGRAVATVVQQNINFDP